MSKAMYYKKFYFEAQVADKRSWLQRRVCAEKRSTRKTITIGNSLNFFSFWFNLLLGWQECGSAALVEIVKGVNYEANEVLSLNLIRLFEARAINHAEPLEPCDKSFKLFKWIYFSFFFFVLCPLTTWSRQLKFFPNVWVLIADLRCWKRRVWQQH